MVPKVSQRAVQIGLPPRQIAGKSKKTNGQQDGDLAELKRDVQRWIGEHGRRRDEPGHATRIVRETAHEIEQGDQQE